MRARSWALASIAGALMSAIVAATATAQSCVDQMASNMQQMAQNAMQCGEDADSLGSILDDGTVTSGRIPTNELAMMCQSGVDVNSQLSAFNECSRVYVCAVQAYAYAIENIDAYGGDCDAAANAGLAQFPVQ